MNRTMEIHDLCAMWPALDGESLKTLKNSITTIGLQEPITLYENKILDGQNRWRACQALGVTPTFVTYDGKDPVNFVIGKNLARRHLNESQRAMIAVKLATFQQGGDRRSKEFKPPGGGLKAVVTQAIAAEQLHVSPRTAQRASIVRQRAAPNVVRAVEQGQMSVAAAVKTLPTPTPPKIVVQPTTNGRWRPREARRTLALALVEAGYAALKRERGDSDDLRTVRDCLSRVAGKL